MPTVNFHSEAPQNRLPALLIATAVVVAVVIALFVFTPRSTSRLEVTGVKIFAPHTESKAIAGDKKHIMGVAGRIEDDLYVIVHVRMTDKLRLPLFIKDEHAVLTAPDNAVLETDALQLPELANAYLAFPELQALVSKPLARDTEIAPGQTAEGDLVLHFPGATEANWSTRKSATVTFDLFHQGPQTVAIPADPAK